MRMNTDIERIGDEASNIAERAIILHGRPALEPYTILEEFFELGLSMVGDAVQAFSDLDSALAESICARDQQAAHLNMKTFRDMTNYMIAESRMIERAVQISFVSHALKRVCDRATNIAESVVFIDKGVSIKHAGQCAV
jgi:phosphate transport system protein